MPLARKWPVWDVAGSAWLGGQRRVGLGAFQFSIGEFLLGPNDRKVDASLQFAAPAAGGSGNQEASRTASIDDRRN